MTSKYQIVIEAKDRASAVFKKVNSGLGSMTKPIKAVSADLSGLARMTRNIGSGLAGAAGIGGPAAGLVGGGSLASVEALTAAMVGLSAEFGKYSDRMTRTSAMTGIATGDLQSLAGAAKLAGISSEAMTSSLTSLGRTMQDSLYGRNDEAAAMFSRLGLSIRYTANGSIDAADMFRQLSGAMGDMSPQTAAMVAGVLGIDASMIPMMKNLKETEQRARDLGAVMGAESVARAAEFERSMNKMGLAASAFGRSIADMAIPYLTTLVDKFTEMFTILRLFKVGDLFDIGLSNLSLDNLKSFFNPTEKSSTSKSTGGAVFSPPAELKGNTAAEKAMDFFRGQGWTKEQAAGLAANIQAESSGNPGSVGDNGRAYGIAQWHPDRQEEFRRWAGTDIRGSSVEDQLAFLNYELTEGKEKPAGDRLRQSSSASESGAVVSRLYERPLATEKEASSRSGLADRLNGGDGKVTVEINVNQDGKVSATAKTDRPEAISLGPTRVGLSTPRGSFPS